VIGARINGDEFTLGGNTLKQSTQIAVRLAENGIYYISVSAGGKFEDARQKPGSPLEPYTTGYSGSRAIPPSWMPEKVNVYLCSHKKKILNSKEHRIPLITAGKIPTAKSAKEIIKTKEADMIAIARPILCDPDWPKKHHEGREGDIRKCIYCNECRNLDAAHEKVVCKQWKGKRGNHL